MIERKGIDAHVVDNFTHLILATNNDWSFPAGMDERRVFALKVSDERQRDDTYFGALAAEIEGGGNEAMLHDLKQRDLTSFNVRAVPQTRELIEQKLLSLSPIEEWWYGLLCRGYVVPGPWPARLDRAVLLQLLQEDLRRGGTPERSLQIRLGKALNKLIPGGARGVRVAGGFWEIPTLDDCRAHFSKVVGGGPKWERPTSQEQFPF